MELKGEIMPAPANEVSRLYAVLEFVVKIILTIGIKIQTCKSNGLNGTGIASTKNFAISRGEHSHQLS
ncbi:MAG: hypothetical protein IJQ85_04340 [Selenomonadaceae bacterium]|nr:hypothetical protein [Selenomonadaceae bacterium]